ncbi:hypothetical protein MHYP_G00035400 [Metynnis hypsauchen]
MDKQPVFKFTGSYWLENNLRSELIERLLVREAVLMICGSSLRRGQDFHFTARLKSFRVDAELLWIPVASLVSWTVETVKAVWAVCLSASC